MEKNIKTKLIELYNLIDNIGWNLSEASQNLCEIEIIIKEKEEREIKDVENLKRELKRDGLYSEKIEYFLENYMRYYNR